MTDDRLTKLNKHKYNAQLVKLKSQYKIIIKIFLQLINVIPGNFYHNN